MTATTLALGAILTACGSGSAGPTSGTPGPGSSTNGTPGPGSSTTAPTTAPTTVPPASPSTGAGTTSPTASPTASAAQPCGHHVAAPRYRHVMWIWMENESLSSVIGSPEAPYLTSLASSCGLALDYRAVTHPSLPNYLAATGGSTFGVTDDGSPASHPIAAPSIFSQVAGAGLTWRAYAEAMPTPCDRTTQGLYAVRHNPAVYYTALGASCTADDVPMGPLNGGTLWRDLQGPAFASFAFVTPDVCDDMHSCPIQQGDIWLSRFLPVVFDSATYRAGQLSVFVVWDEGTGADNRVPALVAAPSVPAGTRSSVAFGHYSLLRTTEDLLGLPPLGQARGATSMAAAFGL